METSTRQIPWLRVGVEGLVIVVSILLALAADASWESRQERAEEQEILAGLVADFEANRDELHRLLDEHEANSRTIVSLATLSDDELLAIEGTDLHRFLRAMNSLGTFDPQDGTLDGVIASGRLRLISDRDLRDALVAWNGRVADAAEEADELRAVTARVGERISHLGGPWRAEVPGPAFAPYPGLLEEMRAFPVLDLTVPANDAQLMAHLREKRRRSISYRLELIPLARRADEMLDLLAARLR